MNEAQHSQLPDRDTRIVRRMTELRSHAEALAEALREVMATVEAGIIAADLNCIDSAREALARWEAK